MKLGEVTDRGYDPMRRALELQQQKRRGDPEMTRIAAMLAEIRDYCDPNFEILCSRSHEPGCLRIQVSNKIYGTVEHHKFAAIFSAALPNYFLRCLIDGMIERIIDLGMPKTAPDVIAGDVIAGDASLGVTLTPLNSQTLSGGYSVSVDGTTWEPQDSLFGLEYWIAKPGYLSNNMSTLAGKK